MFYERTKIPNVFFIYLNFADFPWGCFTAGIVFTWREMCLLVRTVVQGSWNQCDIVMITVMSNLGHYWLNACVSWFWLFLGNWLWKLLSKALPTGNWLKTVVQGFSDWKLTENCCPRLFQLETDWNLLSKALPISRTLSWLQSCLIQDTADFMHEIHDSGSCLEIDLWKQLFKALPINVTWSWL